MARPGRGVKAAEGENAVREIEREAKLVVVPADYRVLKASGTVLECRDQLNVYLHDPSRLEEDLGYLRVRYEAGRRAVVTLKTPLGWRGELRESAEMEVPLAALGPNLNPWPKRSLQVERDLPPEMREHFRGQGIRSLRRLGWMRNLRYLMKVVGVGRFELDRTRLPGGKIHHEVEVETNDEAELHRILAWTRARAPSATASRVGKFSLFLEGKRFSDSGWA
jgi:hypothetical protein